MTETFSVSFDLSEWLRSLSLNSESWLQFQILMFQKALLIPPRLELYSRSVNFETVSKACICRCVSWMSHWTESKAEQKASEFDLKCDCSACIGSRSSHSCQAVQPLARASRSRLWSILYWLMTKEVSLETAKILSMMKAYYWCSNQGVGSKTAVLFVPTLCKVKPRPWLMRRSFDWYVVMSLLSILSVHHLLLHCDSRCVGFSIYVENCNYGSRLRLKQRYSKDCQGWLQKKVIKKLFAI